VRGAVWCGAWLTMAGGRRRAAAGDAGGARVPALDWGCWWGCCVVGATSSAEASS